MLCHVTCKIVITHACPTRSFKDLVGICLEKWSTVKYDINVRLESYFLHDGEYLKAYETGEVHLEVSDKPR